MIYSAVILTALIAIASLAVDYGRYMGARGKLQEVADAAARYAVRGIRTGDTLTRANAVASQNAVEGESIVFQAADVEIGNWNKSTRTFASGALPSNAVRVTANRNKARGNALPLMFASLIGGGGGDLRAQSVALGEEQAKSTYVGLNGFAVVNNLLAANYNSGTTTTPESGGYSGRGLIGSNGSVTAKNNEQVGQVILGPSGSSNLTNVTVITLPENLPAPAIDFSGVPASNPGGISKNYTVNGTTILPGGVYHFTSLTLKNNATLKFSGVSTVYVDGNVVFENQGSIVAHDEVPANLKIRMRGAGTYLGGEDANKVDVTADIEAPQSLLTGKNTLVLRGRGVFDRIEARNNAEFYYDETLPPLIPDVWVPVPIVTVK